MSRFVSFPGLVGSYASTDDTNILDADTANLQQSKGGWLRLNVQTDTGTLTPVPGLSFGDNALVFEQLLDGTTQWGMSGSGTDAVQISAATEYSYLARYEVSAVRSWRFFIQYYDAGGGALSNGSSPYVPVAAADTFEDLVFTHTSPALATFVQVSLQSQAITGDTHTIDVAQIREGSDPTFVPSLRIVGSLFEEFNSTPDDPPVVFAGDGTPLTVGDGWSGDLFTYTRHDGPDASAPIVASFAATDIPI